MCMNTCGKDDKPAPVFVFLFIKLVCCRQDKQEASQAGAASSKPEKGQATAKARAAEPGR